MHCIQRNVLRIPLMTASKLNPSSRLKPQSRQFHQLCRTSQVKVQHELCGSPLSSNCDRMSAPRIFCGKGQYPSMASLCGQSSRWNSNVSEIVPPANTIGSSSKLCIVFTCKVCQTRSAKMFSKHSYERGIVIVQCPGCKNNHLIADNLGWFDHIQERNIEEILQSKGESVKKVTDALGTMEVTVEDVVGLGRRKSITDGSEKT